MAHSIHATPKAALHEDARHWWPIFMLVFVVFLAVALAGALLGQPWRTWLPGAEGVKSIPGGVRAAVYTLMSHLS
jgi:light-harvesting complex 1 beta chain